MLGDDINQQLEYQAQQTFRADEPTMTIDTGLQPIFLKSELPWKFDKNTKINYLVVSNNVFILHLNEKTLQRRCLDETPKDTKTSSFPEVQMPDAISKVFLDPYGRLVIVSTRDKRDVYILVSSTNSLKLIKKPIRFGNATSFILVSVSWCNRFLQQQNDVVALLAGQDGSIYEVSIRSDGELSSCNEVYPSFKSIMDMNRDSVTGIYCDVKSAYEDNTNIFVVITTQKALYYFEHQIDSSRKSDYFSTFFAFFRDASLSDLKHLEFPSGNAQSEIQLFVKRKSSTTQLLQRQFAWITGAGLFYTEIDPVNVQNSFIQRHRIIDYYIDKSLKQRDEEQPPKSVALTEFHCLMMFPNENQIRAVCTVNKKIVMIDGSMASGRPVCYARDQIRDQLWACTDEHVLRYTINDERRDVWRVFMQKQDFQKAFETCVVVDDPDETARRQRSINSKHADYLFNEKKYTLSATIYATSDTSFEDVTLKFFALRDKEPLREYLQAVLQYQKPSTDSTQITILTLWLTDLFLNELDELRQKDSTTTNQTTTSPNSNNRSPFNLQSQDEFLDENSRKEKFDEIRRKFQYFLRKPEIQSCLKEHRSAMYDLLTSHGDLDDLILFAEHVQDYERVILLYLEREDYEKALKTLEPLSNYQLLYKYSPTLIEKLPENLISVWKKKYNERFEAKELLPAMIAYSRAYPTGKAVLDFLKFCLTRGCIDKSIHNYLLSEYVKFDPSQIMPYLRNQKEDPHIITYDPRYALRLCIDHDLKEESVFLYRLLNMHEEAVDTALQVNVKLAKECASTVPSSDERAKNLWLKIASSVVTQGHDLNEVMEILEDCGNDLLKIEDILPLFPDFETIDQFKKPIIKSLEHYNDRLNDLRNEMNDASKSIDDIRDDLAKYRTRCVASIDSYATCSLCEQALMLQSTFYIFACGHYFHGDCLFTYVRRLMKRKDEHNLDETNRSQTATKSGQVNEQNKQKLDKSLKINAIQKDIDTVNRLQSIIASGIAPPSRDMESVQQELDDLVASQCVLCGETAVDYLDQPLDAIL
ncbi:unnamed protein product [Rotaria sordida]|uniref:Pep3/Vps18 beta-propeller domain-containing protein n=1 Tax=Rotaria sordida TaxID=392033 RepID=A0A814VF55_9BILA|nr:unnamed protein product [Rotaria sordida]CAF1306084.1 unnamed protein product [Rotaria sordida]CAF1455427.1 unnamed protein product [Rotaria sordida]